MRLLLSRPFWTVLSVLLGAFVGWQVSRMTVYRENHIRRLQFLRLRSEVKMALASRELRQGMSYEDVVAVLGDPEYVRHLSENIRNLSYFVKPSEILDGEEHISHCSVYLSNDVVVSWCLSTAVRTQ